MDINNPDLLFPGDQFTLRCEFEQNLKSFCRRGRTDQMKESSSSPSDSDDDKGGGGSHSVDGVDGDFDLMWETMEYIGTLEFEKAVYSDEVKKRIGKREIKKGETFDVLSLLWKRYNNSNHLIRIINGEIQRDEVVQVDYLRGKLIFLCCVFAPCLVEGNFTNILQGLSILSRELSARNDVEMVLVIKVRPQWSDYETVARHFVSTFSCLAVPFDHLFRIDSICMCLNMGAQPTGVLVNRNQVVIQDTLAFIFKAGMDAFPFTDANIQSCLSLEVEMKSLEQILASNRSAFPYRICHGKREVASVSELGQKLVGLYLFITGEDMLMLRNVYRQCQARGLEFEVVVFCMPFSVTIPPEELEHVMTSVLQEKKLPWWVFPFNSTVFRRLFMRSDGDVSDRLFIVLPNGKLMEPHGELVIHHFGIDAYPFTRESLIMKNLDKLRQLTLESSLLGGFLYRGSERVSVAHLRGRNVILWLDWVEHSEEHYKLLIGSYFCWKAIDPCMEMVYACLNTHISHNSKSDISKMPWLVYLRDPSKSEFVADDLFVYGLKTSKIVAFGKDSRICSFHVEDHLFRHGPAAFPFCGDLFEEICVELTVKDAKLLYGMVWSDRASV